jgi:hypothetical protein
MITVICPCNATAERESEKLSTSSTPKNGGRPERSAEDFVDMANAQSMSVPQISLNTLRAVARDGCCAVSKKRRTPSLASFASAVLSKTGLAQRPAEKQIPRFARDDKLGLDT